MGKKRNTTVLTTKSGTKVYVVGNYTDQEQRDREGDKFVNYYNNDFTEIEQQRIGNIYYDFLNEKHNTTQYPEAKPRNKHWLAQTGTFTGKDAQKLNPRHEKMVDITFLPEVRNDESVIAHELIHAKKFMEGIKGHHQNERKIDFEMVGRITHHGIENIEHGYYFSPEGNPYLKRKKGISLKKKGEIAKQGVYDDRELLTGSLEKHMIGKPVEKKVHRKYPESFFFKRDI
jgi:hypothetical protein